MANKQIKFVIRSLLLVAAGMSTSVMQPTYAADSTSTSLDTVIVTGSRVERDTAFESPVPMVTIDGKSLGDSGFSVLGDALVNLPQALVNANTQSSQQFLYGQSRVDLRALGSNRTLVLLDGKRFITGDFRAPATDLNMIPASMVERIEVISGGASAVYGSEAIAGVVNIITKKKIDGFVADLQGGVSSENDGEEFKASLSYGSSFAAGRGSFSIGGEYADVEPINQTDRGWAYPGIRRNNTVSPQTVIPASRTNLSPTATFQLTSSNSVSIALDRSALYSNSAACRTTTVSAFCQDPWLTYSAAYNLLQAPLERRAARARLDFALTDNVSIFGDAIYSAAEATGQSSPAFSNAATPSSTALAIRAVMHGDNAYLNGTSPLATQLRSAWTTAGLSLVRGTSVNVAKFWEEFDTRDTEIFRESYRIQTGLEGAFQLADRNFKWDTYAQYGELSGHLTAYNVPNMQRLQQSLDAVVQAGQVVCFDATARSNGCVPWDVINGPTPQAVAWSNANARFDGQATQTVVAANADGSLFDLPGGPLGIAAGVEYREEFSDYIQDDASANGQLFINSVGRTRGEYNAKEIYAETVAPLLSRQPGAYLLSVEAAARFADYSTAGTVNQWRLQATWAPISAVSLRTSIGTAVRAPNITEAFGPRGSNSVSNALDPCDNAQITAINSDPQRQAIRIANCASVIPGYNPSTFQSNIGPSRPSLTTRTGSNSDLFEETARTFTAGVVFTPGESRRLRTSVDYWQIKIDDAISTIPLNTLFTNLCYDAAEPVAENRFCDLIQRDASTGNVLEVSLTNQNVQSIETSGIDVALQYEQPIAVGAIDFRVDATKVIRWDLYGFPGGPVTHYVGALTKAIPEYKAQGSLGWRQGRLYAQWQTRFIDSLGASESDPPSSRDPFYTGNYFEHDLRIAFAWTDEFAVRIGALNITNETPPLLPEVGNATEASNSATYDNRGRWFYAGFHYSFGATD